MPLPAPDVGTVLRLGANTTTSIGSLPLNGLLDEVYFFNQAITPAQIQTLLTTNTFATSTASVLPNGTPVNITSSTATLDVNGTSQIIGSLNGVAGSTIALGGGSLTIGVDNSTSSFAGNITDAGSANSATGGSIVKVGSGSLTLNGNNSYTGSTTVSAGTLVIGKSFTTGGAVSIASGSSLVLSQNGSHVLSTPSLSITGSGTLDLKDNDLLVPYTSVSPAAAIRNYLIAGYHGGAWNGTGGIDSSLAAGETAIGYGDAADLGITSIDGVPIAGNAVIVKYTYYGDSSLDGKVDLGNDFDLFLEGYLTGAGTWELGDYNYDGKVDNTDFHIFVDAIKTQGVSQGELDAFIAASPLLSNAQKASLISVVPEPSAIAALTLAAGIFTSRRRSNRRK